MPLLKLGVMIGLALFGGVALFLGAVVLLTSLQHGAISYSQTVDGRSFTETVSRATDPDRFWQLWMWLGAAPALFGGAALLFAIRAWKHSA